MSAKLHFPDICTGEVMPSAAGRGWDATVYLLVPTLPALPAVKYIRSAYTWEFVDAKGMEDTVGIAETICQGVWCGS